MTKPGGLLSMIIALAAPPVADSIENGIAHVTAMQRDAAAVGAAIICFPEAYLPGLRGTDLQILAFDENEERNTLAAVQAGARNAAIATIFSHEHISESGRHIAATVIDRHGKILGVQTKNQIAPSEDPYYAPGRDRQIFEIEGLTFGIVICHEGWRYPETVRWAARRGARVVFHPHHTGSDTKGIELTRFGDPRAPYYEKAMCLRSIENGIYFASTNYGLRYPESATCVIDPDGHCLRYLPYGKPGLLIVDIDLDKATGLYADRFTPLA